MADAGYVPHQCDHMYDRRLVPAYLERDTACGADGDVG